MNESGLRSNHEKNEWEEIRTEIQQMPYFNNYLLPEIEGFFPNMRKLTTQEQFYLFELFYDKSRYKSDLEKEKNRSQKLEMIVGEWKKLFKDTKALKNDLLAELRKTNDLLKPSQN